MSLRTAVLKSAVGQVGRTSFTRSALSTALSTLPPTDPAYRASPLDENTIDTVFGPGSSGPRALVQAWEEAGLETVKADGKTSVRDALARRLEWSAKAGEHLVEAHALLASPSSTPSIPIPTTLLRQLRSSIRLPPLYRPPGSPYGASSSTASAGPISRILEETGGQLPLFNVDPLTPLAYAWRIADAAVYASRPHVGQKGPNGEPWGAGVEWYTSRAALALAYLNAEAYLLQPISPETAQATNPHLPAAMAQLGRGLRRYDDAKSLLGAVEGGADSVITFVEQLSRSVTGIVRSRGF